MPGLLRSLFRTVKRRIKKGLRDQRTHEMYRATCRLLESRDHEQVSVALIAREAGISVGAFYQRYRSKDAFLGMVVSTRLGFAREGLKRNLAPEHWRRSSAAAVTQAIVVEMMHHLHGPSAGVVRAALKRGHLDREKLGPLLEYRQALGDCAVALLAHRVKQRNPERAVRSAAQMAEATALDALLHQAGALPPGSWRMAHVLSAMMLAMLGLSGDARAASRQEGHDDDAMLVMPPIDIVALPIPEPAALPAPARRRKTAPKPPPERIPTITPKQPAPAVEIPESPRRGRHRPRY